MLKPFAAEMSSSTVPPAMAGVRREPARTEAGAFARSFESWPGDVHAFSAADPDTLARAVRAHKAGDAFAQAALTLALMLAIGAVAVVLSSGRAAAAGLLTAGVVDHVATFAALAVAGGALLFLTRAALRRVRVPARERHWK